ncbi:MAG: metallophosphoesterase [Deltaproteobacteria bacterium]|nr:metallophosphoesterase [Deltaproteobacteria bacterium]
MTFIAMGDLGRGVAEPSYVYDVFDLMHRVARDCGADMWLPLGDIDNAYEGNPNAMDPFFFSLYNAYHNRVWPPPPRPDSIQTSPYDVEGFSRRTDIIAFRQAPYLGLLGGLPVYPTVGNHDVGACEASGGWWSLCLRSFNLPPTAPACDVALASLNAKVAGHLGICFGKRFGKVLFASLPVVAKSNETQPKWTVSYGKEKWEAAANERVAKLVTDKHDWLVACLHDFNHAYGNWDTGELNANAEPHLLTRAALVDGGCDLVLTGHQHAFRWNRKRHPTKEPAPDGNDENMRVLIAGMGGYTDDDPGDSVRRPGFVLARIRGNVLEHWKFDTHRYKANGEPIDRATSFDPHVAEYCRITKAPDGTRTMREYVLHEPWPLLPRPRPLKAPPRFESGWNSAHSDDVRFVPLGAHQPSNSVKGGDFFLQVDTAKQAFALYRFDRARYYQYANGVTKYGDAYGDPMENVSYTKKVNLVRTLQDITKGLFGDLPQGPEGRDVPSEYLFVGGEHLLVHGRYGGFRVLRWGGGKLVEALVAGAPLPKPESEGRWQGFAPVDRLAYLGGDWLIKLTMPQYVPDMCKYKLWRIKRDGSCWPGIVMAKAVAESDVFTQSLVNTWTSPFAPGGVKPSEWSSSDKSPFTDGVRPSIVFGAMARFASWLVGVNPDTGVCEFVPMPPRHGADEEVIDYKDPPFLAGRPIRMSSLEGPRTLRFLGPSSMSPGAPLGDLHPLIHDRDTETKVSRIWEVSWDPHRIGEVWGLPQT